jgi:hypothetical protein
MRKTSSVRHDGTLARFYPWIILWMAVVAPGDVLAAPQPAAQLKASVNATAITIGDVLTLRIEVKHPESLKIAFPQAGASLDQWSVRGSNRWTSGAESGLIRDVLELQLTIYKTGEFEIPSLGVETVTADGQKAILSSEPIKIKVESVLDGKQDTLKDVKPQTEIPANYKPFLFFLAALGSLAYLIYRLIRHLKNRQRALPRIPRDMRTPEEVAHDAIRQLLARKLIDQGLFKEFYLELSEIMKRFLGVKLVIPSLERTTEEFTRDLRATALPPEQYRMVRHFLEDCDLVKFAKYRPGAEEVERIVVRSQEIIDTAGVPQSQSMPVLEVSR